MTDEKAEISSEELSVDALVEQLTKERDEFKDIALRVQAEFENYRKRSATQLIDESDRNAGRIVESLLSALDACEAAMVHGAAGVEPIFSSLLSALQKQGLEVLNLVDTVFDPSVADAVVHEPADDESGASETRVVEVMRTGYLWKGRVLRAAMVKVKG
ncbi:MAG: nucleotide exchange factor GrpE [Actinobacteria bacterium]|jgi:molecular chaperone GrpE|nr:nucleotide exchange factor GrpE [Actinomycetota bacterium]NCW84121.1 nucleotide exchange factor GrpE [Acidimicrobiia bacterium]NDD00221.1 nucleotide exchange factor GrpE [bacterium]HBQ52656.1 nucleotide exchange factor GrpE [Acidimicrobium sp.]NBP42076.1 nucleotide exchange factor GrpE [Actinomycetota bacterium]